MVMLAELIGKFCRRILKIMGLKNQTNEPLLRIVNADKLLPKQKLIRLGTKYGGWLIPLEPDLHSESVCYLVGAGEDISFDCALVERFGVKARIVDPTPRAIEHFKLLTQAVDQKVKFPINGSISDFYTISKQQFLNIRYLPYGLAGENREMRFFFPKDPSHVSCSTMNIQKTDNWFMAYCYRLSSLMKEQGDASIALLKIDIEGGEYEVIDDIIRSDTLPSLLLIEFDEVHTPINDGAMMRIQDRIIALENVGMQCVAVDGSNATFQKLSS